jgi:hypothetical protein
LISGTGVGACVDHARSSLNPFPHRHALRLVLDGDPLQASDAAQERQGYFRFGEQENASLHRSFAAEVATRG